MVLSKPRTATGPGSCPNVSAAFVRKRGIFSSASRRNWERFSFLAATGVGPVLLGCVFFALNVAPLVALSRFTTAYELPSLTVAGFTTATLARSLSLAATTTDSFLHAILCGFSFTFSHFLCFFYTLSNFVGPFCYSWNLWSLNDFTSIAFLCYLCTDDCCNWCSTTAPRSGGSGPDRFVWFVCAAATTAAAPAGVASFHCSCIGIVHPRIVVLCGRKFAAVLPGTDCSLTVALPVTALSAAPARALAFSLALIR